MKTLDGKGGRMTSSACLRFLLPCFPTGPKNQGLAGEQLSQGRFRDRSSRIFPATRDLRFGGSTFAQTAVEGTPPVPTLTDMSPPSASDQTALDTDGQSYRREGASDSIMGYDPNLVLIAAGVGLLLLFIRIGPLSFLLIILISCTLSALPDFRSIVDSTLGTALSTQPRLQQTFASIGLQFKPSHQFINQSTTSDVGHSDQNLQKLDQLPDQLLTAFDSLFGVIIRDYVESWYLLPTVSTGDKAFLHQLRNSLDHVLLRAFAKLTTKSSKETMIYLIGCLSMNLVRELNDRSNSKSQTSARDRIIQRQVQTRRISEEILLTLGAPSITSSPLTLKLATEILTVQLISITSGYNHHWFNQTLIDSLGSGTPTQVTIASPSPSPSNTATTTAPPLFDPTNQDGHQHDLQASRGTSQSGNTTTHLSNPHSNVSSISDDINSCQGNNILIAYLKSPGSSILAAGTSLSTDVSLQQLFDRTPRWTPTTKVSDSERSKLLSSSSNQVVERLVKLFNQFELFQTTGRSANFKFDILKADAISVLSALVPLMQHVLDQLLADQPSKEYISKTWLSVIVETLRRLELRPSIETNIFGNLQEWILDQLRSLKAEQVPGNSRSDVDEPNDHHRTPTTHTFQQDKIYYMTLPNIPTTGSSHDTGALAQLSQDLSSSGSELTWDKSKNSATEAVLNKHRAMSISRNANSPASPDRGLPQRANSIHDPFGSPNQRRKSTGFSHPSPSFSRVPEEGDMTEGYSLDEGSDKEDLCYSPVDQPTTTHQIASTSPTALSSGFDDKKSSQSGSRPTSIILPSGSHSNQPASFSVSVMDMSPASAFDSKTGLIKQKKELLLLIAIETPPEPGFIVTRGWPELERMDLAINKKKLVGVGTKAFPRALLPTNLNFKTIDHVRRELEGYLECLVKDERYSKSEPVLKFFAKERSGMNGRGSAINNILNSTSSTLDSIGKGVASVGKEVVTKPVDFATLGLNRLSKGVFSGLPFGASPTALRDEDEARGQYQFRNSADSLYGFTGETSNPEHLRGTQNDQDVNYQQFDSTEPKAMRQKQEEQFAAFTTAGALPNSQPSSASILARDANPSTSSNLPEVESPNFQPSKPFSSTRKVESTMANESIQTVKPSGPEKLNKPIFTSSNAANNPSTAVTLSGKEFDAVIIAIMSILEAAYGLDQNNNTPWSMKRGVLRVLETILRTTSFSDFIRVNLCKFAEKFGQVGTYVDLINSVLTSLTSHPDHDGQKDDTSNQNPKEKSNSRKKFGFSNESVRSLDSLDSISDNLAPSEDFDPNQYRSLVSDPLEEQPQPQVNLNTDQKKETARKLFIDSWSNLKIGLGSNATDLAANKVFNLFQEFDPEQPQVDQATDHRNSNEVGNGAFVDSSVSSASSHPLHDKLGSSNNNNTSPSGIELIVHNLLLDLIRITLLL